MAKQGLTWQSQMNPGNLQDAFLSANSPTLSTTNIAIRFGEKLIISLFRQPTPHSIMT
jgi:hypothetical protein